MLDINQYPIYTAQLKVEDIKNLNKYSFNDKESIARF